jgi:chemotaxis protein CheC
MAIARLTSLHLDTLQEMSNIGVGQAATALSQLLNRRIDIRIPRVAVTPFKHAVDGFGGPESPVAAVGLRIGGDALGHVILLFEPEAAARMAGALTAGPGTTASLADPMARSVLQEVGNILASAYLNALGRLTGLVFLPSIPVFVHDMVGAVVDEALIEQGAAGDVALVMETTFDVEGEALAGQMLLLPNPQSLERIFRAVGVTL